MLATILKSERAVNTTMAIIDTFVTARELARTMEALQTVTDDGGEQQKGLLHRTGTLLSDLVARNLRTESSETEIELNFAVVKEVTCAPTCLSPSVSASPPLVTSAEHKRGLRQQYGICIA